MFSYYGSKSKVVDYYPKPKFNKKTTEAIWCNMRTNYDNQQSKLF